MFSGIAQNPFWLKLAYSPVERNLSLVLVMTVNMTLLLVMTANMVMVLEIVITRL